MRNGYRRRMIIARHFDLNTQIPKDSLDGRTEIAGKLLRRIARVEV